MRRKRNGILLLLAGLLMIWGCGEDNGSQAQQEFAGASIETVGDTQGMAEPQKEVLVTETEKPEDTQNVPEAETENPETETRETELQETENSETELPETETEKPSEKINQEAASGDMPVISVTEDEKEWYSKDGQDVVYKVSNSIVTVENEGFDELKKVFAKRWAGVGDEANYENSVQDAKESYERDKEEGFHFVPYSSTDDVMLGRIGGSFVSFFECSGFWQGALEENYYGLTFELKSGKELQLCDILSDEEGFCREASNYIAEKWDEEYKNSSIAKSYKGEDGKYLPEKFEEDIKEAMEPSADPNMLGTQWYLSEEGFVLVYQQWSLGIHGGISVTVPYEKINQYLKPEYAKQ